MEQGVNTDNTAIKDLVDAYLTNIAMFEERKAEAQITLSQIGNELIGGISSGRISIRLVERERAGLAKAIRIANSNAKQFAFIMAGKGGEKCLRLSEAILEGDILKARQLAEETGNVDGFQYMYDKFQIVDNILHTKFLPVETEALSLHLPCISYSGHGVYIQTEKMNEISPMDIDFIIGSTLNKVTKELEANDLIGKVLAMSETEQKGQSLFSGIDSDDQENQGYGLKR